ncbi:hypothetical protein C8R46DRAFT_1220989 [Mycena filopes]|nr:hypothetical protein C8R46DRAFT_1220989 [Mycena filopes]
MLSRRIPAIDIASESAGTALASALPHASIDTLVICAGYFAAETFDARRWKAALNMIGKLLSLDLNDRGISAAISVTPDEAAASLIPFIDSFTLDMSDDTGTRAAQGELWPPFFAGYRHFETVHAYKTEPQLGAAFHARLPENTRHFDWYLR